ncbi:MAG: ribosome maturation factor RimP [Clostridia bacterium]|nr:ribosome maturation factor RimP [Clostridia bacterium]MBQ8792713.1 ribosome maturation factor RimP [Clostridia bacterium]
MAGKVKAICEEKIVPLIEEAGYEVVQVEYVKKSDGMNLTFYIDNENGIQIEDCEKVSKVIDSVIDELDPTDGQSYILSISSPGIDRPIKTDRDFKRNLNKEIKVTLFAKQNGKKEFEGELISYNENEFVIREKDKEISFNRQQVAHIVPVIKF